MPYLDPVIDSQTRTEGCSEDELPIRAPLADARIGRLDRADLLVVLLEVVNVHLAREVPEAGDEHEAAVRGEEDGVARREREVVRGDGFGVEDGRFGGHVAVDDAEFFAVG